MVSISSRIKDIFMSTKKNLQMMWKRESANNGDEALEKLQ